MKSLRASNEVLKEKIASLSEKNGVFVDDALHEDLCSMMKEHNTTVVSNSTEGSFNRIFWQQQQEASMLEPCDGIPK